MGFISEFRSFAVKGNVVDMAVGVIIGGAFGKIVNSVIEDLIMPVVGRAVGNVDFINMFLPLSGQTEKNLVDAKKAGAVLAYGSFITTVINFTILAFCIFMMVKAITNLRKQEETKPAPPAGPTNEEKLLSEIRDLLKSR